jgi:RimJ/RimL family protein N-acetyltransferase
MKRRHANAVMKPTCDLRRSAVSIFSRLPCYTDGIRLRALREDDFKIFFGYRSDARVARYQGWWPMDEQKARSFLREQGANVRTASVRNRLQLAVAHARTDALMGDIGIWLLNDDTEAEIGITVTPAAQGRGVGRSAVRAVSRMLFAMPMLIRVRASADARNAPSRRMLLATGFREADIADVFVKQAPCVEHRYILERDRFAFAP